MAGTAIAPDVQVALKSLRVEQWVYLRSTTRYAIFLAQAAKEAYAVLGLNNSVEEIVGTSAPEFDSSSRFRQVGLNEINSLAVIFAFSCGGTLVPNM